MSLSSLKWSIVKTLAYADVFEWPVCEDEIFAKVQLKQLEILMN